MKIIRGTVCSAGLLAGAMLAASCGSAAVSPDADGPTASVAAALKKNPPHKAGCSDGTREGFVDASTWPDIAGCSGAWTIPGLHTDNPGIAPACPGLPTFDTTTPACHRKAGNDGKNCEGHGCDVADLCARGWHVCTGATEVTAKSATGCVGATSTGEPLFFATRQSSNGCDQCANGTLVGPTSSRITCAPGSPVPRGRATTPRPPPTTTACAKPIRR